MEETLRLEAPPRERCEHSWWQREGERYWLEITHRDDVGGDLTHECYDMGDRRMPSWTLARDVMRRGDTVFHFDIKADAIVYRSRVAGRCVVTDGCWWHVRLKDRTRLRPLPFAAIAGHGATISELFVRLKKLSPPPYYLPFIIAPTFRLPRSYLAKFPQDLVTLFPQLLE
jgi:hypothetical protein